jgi:outer membrane protein assembly factor BamB
MSSESPLPTTPPRPVGIRWWPAGVILGLMVLAMGGVQSWSEFPFQRRNLICLGIAGGALGLGVLWWLFLSRARWTLRLAGIAGIALLAGMARLTLRIRGVTGDLIPIVETRWSRTPAAPMASTPTRGAPAGIASQASAQSTAARLPGDYPQFLGKNRNGIVDAISLQTNWTVHSPQLLWRQPVGGAWSGFSVVGDRAVTQEQSGDDELVVCRNVVNGTVIWRTTNSGRYFTPIAGEGPRSSPTIADGRVITLGARGWLQVLDLTTGQRLWGTNILEFAQAGMPEWGLSGSPLVISNRVVVSAGGRDGRSLLLWNVQSGQLIASGGSSSAEYSSPYLTELAGVPQILQFNHREISAHDPTTARVLWSRPFGVQFPLVANPVRVSSNSVFLSAGYGVGGELLELSQTATGSLEARSVWTSKRLKAKFSNPVFRDGFIYGLDDGILACLDAKDGSQRWKEGRHGHGQGLLVGELYLLMAENGELVLLHPTPDGPGELARLKVFSDKTWNPIALAGDLLLLRNDREAACYRLPVR